MSPPLSPLTFQVENNDVKKADSVRALRMLLGVGFLASLFMTYPMFLSYRPFPLVPIHPFFAPFPAPIDGIFLLTLGAMVLVSIITPSGIATTIIITQVLLLWAQDQNRIHPWLFFYLLVYGALTPPWGKIRPHPRSFEPLSLIQFVLVCVYGWTGLQKMRASYFTEVVPALIRSLPTLPPEVTAIFFTATPIIEIGIALAITTPLLRRLGVISAVLLHTGIIFMTSPFGRNENSSVIPWNLTMMGSVSLLFWNSSSAWRDIICPYLSLKRIIYVGLCGILPLLGYLGYWNTYLSFGVYAGANAQGYAFLRDESFKTLPAKVQRVTYSTQEGLHELPFDAWAQASLLSPPSPEPAVIEEIARYTCQKFAISDDQVAVIIRNHSRPWESVRREKRYICKGFKLIEQG